MLKKTTIDRLKTSLLEKKEHLKKELNKMGLNPNKNDLDVLLEKIQEKIKIQDYISEKELEELAKKVIK